MKHIIFIILILSAFNSTGQSITERLKDVKTYDEAEKIIKVNPQFHLDALNLNSSIDTSNFQKQFYFKKKGDIFTIGTVVYKVLYDTSALFSRVNYIFLDGLKLSVREVDSIRKLIIYAYKSGIPFDSLAIKYNMDGNQTFGDTNWFSQEVMVKEFSEAVLQHKISDIFTVDVVKNNWFYVVKKTFDTQKFKQMMLIRIQNGS